MNNINRAIVNVAHANSARCVLEQEILDLLHEQPDLTPDEICGVLVEYYRPEDLAASGNIEAAQTRVRRMDTLRDLAGWSDVGLQQDEPFRKKPGFIERVVRGVSNFFTGKPAPSARTVALGRLDNFPGGIDELLAQAALPREQRHGSISGMNDDQFKETLSYAVRRERARTLLSRTYQNPGKGRNEPTWDQKTAGERITGVNHQASLGYIQREIDQGRIAQTQVEQGTQSPKAREVAGAMKSLSLDSTWADRVAQYLTKPKTTVTSVPHTVIDAGRKLVDSGAVTPYAGTARRTTTRRQKSKSRTVSEHLFNILNRKML